MSRQGGKGEAGKVASGQGGEGDAALREQLGRLLEWHEAHADFDAAVAVISPLMAKLAAITAAPSICARTRSGLTIVPASITCSTRGMRSCPLLSTSTSTTDAT